MKKRILSLLLTAVLLCSVFSCAWAAEGDKYQAFVDRYGPYYGNIDWKQAIADMGGLDAIDWKKLVHTLGYEGNRNITWYLMQSTILELADYGTFWDIFDMISQAQNEVNEAHYAAAPERVKKYCPTRIMDWFPWDVLDEFLELLENRLVPQAVQLIRERVPAFAHAAPDELTTEMGLGLGNGDGLAAAIQVNPSTRTNISLKLYVYIDPWLKTLEDGSRVLSRDESAVSASNSLIVHEMVHAFMSDYNRRGMATPFTVDMVDSGMVFYTEDAEAITREELIAKQAVELFPEWFMEGCAELLSGGYFYQYEHYQYCGLANPEGTQPTCSAEYVREAYRKFADSLIEPKGIYGNTVFYCIGPIAVAWLSDMQRQADGHPSAFAFGADGSITAVNEKGLLDGFSRILERSHNGETLDEIIRRITAARFLGVEDFNLRFIQGGAGGSDEGTAEFCAAWLNHLEALPRQKGYVVAGSLLVGLDSNALDFLDWNKTASSTLYVPVSRDGIKSHVPYETVKKTAVSSYFSIDAWRTGARYRCAEGADGVYVKGSGVPLPFVFERTVDNDAAFSHFKTLEVNGSVLKAGSQYRASPGSVNAELMPAYLDTLAPAIYKLTAVFDDEKAVTVNFTVQPKPGTFEAVAQPGSTFSFKKVWQGGSEHSIDFTLYKADGSVYRHGVDKKAVSASEWQYSAWFNAPAACYVIEQPVPGYQTRYENVGIYAGITDRCCDGGTIVNYRVPRTGDEAPIWLWLGCALAGLAIIAAAVHAEKRKKACGK